MFGNTRFSTLLLLTAATTLGINGYQAPQTRQPYIRPATPNADQAIPEIHIDDRCRILPDPARRVVGKKKPRPRNNSEVCHLESGNTSSHVEEAIVGSVRLRSNVSIEEQEYVLQDITDDPVAFVVEQPLRKDWQVDSDPRPTEIIDSTPRSDIPSSTVKTAIFRVYAKPGETVRLHVGVRHTRTKQHKL